MSLNTFKLSTCLGLIAGILVIASCTTTNKSSVGSSTTTVDGNTARPDNYSAAINDPEISDVIEDIQKSVLRITSTGIYQSFYFEDELYTLADVKSTKLKDIASRSIILDESTAGTAIALADRHDSAVLLTCAHVVNLPDTVISYNNDPNLPPNTFVKSVTVKKRQNNIIYGNPGLGTFQILSSDEVVDLALIQVNTRDFEDVNASILNINTGDSRELKWGSKVYIFGYPKGFPMVTTGIVSNPNRDNKGSYLTDALFNKGISGGLIIAMRDQSQNFEWIGVASTASASREIYLAPNPSKMHKYQRFDMYADTAFIEQRTEIDYGITEPISILKVNDFILENSKVLKRHGYNISALMK